MSISPSVGNFQDQTALHALARLILDEAAPLPVPESTTRDKLGLVFYPGHNVLATDHDTMRRPRPSGIVEKSRYSKRNQIRGPGGTLVLPAHPVWPAGRTKRVFGKQEWSDHCHEHVDVLGAFPICFDHLVCSGVLASPGYCPCRLGNENLEPHDRMYQFLYRTEWLEHIQRYLEVLEWEETSAVSTF